MNCAYFTLKGHGETSEMGGKISPDSFEFGKKINLWKEDLKIDEWKCVESCSVTHLLFILFLFPE